MWFAKWFGGRKNVEETDEPARFAAPRQPAEPASQPADVPVRKTTQTGPKKGFDPYNSGAFERRNAWERVSRR